VKSSALILHCLRFDVFERGRSGQGASLYSGALLGFLLSMVEILAAQSLDRREAAVPLFLAVSSLLAFPGILSEISVTFFDPRDLAFLRCQPVTGAEYFKARMVAMAVLLVHKAMSFGLLPATYLGFQESGVGAAAAFFCTFLALLCTLAAMAFALFLGMRRFLHPARLRDLLVWVEVALFVVLTAGWLLLFNTDVARAWSSWDLLASKWLPSSWFSALHARLVGTPGDPTLAGLSLLCMAATIAALVFLRAHYLGALNFSAAFRPARPNRRLRPLSLVFERLFVQEAERSSFRLALALLFRERGFRLQAYPLFAYPLVFLAFGLAKDDRGLFALCFSHFATLTLPLLLLFLRFSDHPEAAWWLRFHLPSSGPLLSGARKALFLCMLLPVYAIITFLLVYDRGLWFGAWNGLLSVSLAGTVAVGPRWCEPFVPFSQRLDSGIEAGAAFARTYLLFGVALLVGFLQFLVSITRPGLLPVFAGLAFLWMIRELRRPCPVEGEVSSEPPFPMVAVQTGSGFPARLRREIRGLLALHGVVLAGAVLFGLLA